MSPESGVVTTITYLAQERRELCCIAANAVLKSERKEPLMIGQIREFVIEQRQALVERVERFREAPMAPMRELAMTSAGGIKSLKAPVRAFAHSGVRLAAVSQHAMRDLIELESEVVTSALTEAAERLERVVEADGVVDLVLDQAGLMADWLRESFLGRPSVRGTL